MYICFPDLEKTHETVVRKGVQEEMKIYGVGGITLRGSEEFIRVI